MKNNSKASKYDHLKIEKKWQKEWAKNKIYQTKDSKAKPKTYILDMFPYPSGDGLHVGHPKGYIATDIYSRFKRMNGFNILHPMGWDAFGLPAENYAIKNKIHPDIAMKRNVKRFKEQLEKIGFDYDWSREINTTDPKYYKWTQWIFLQLYKKGLAYESWEPINWCPSCQTGLANEDLEDGKCERCSSAVIKKPMRQWVLKITDYADRLLKDLNNLNWPESAKESQRNWIGRSEGVNLKNKIKDLDIEFEVYDSIPQTFLAQTFTVIAPEHPLVEKLIAGTKYEKPVKNFVKKIIEEKAKNRFNLENNLEGIFTGRYVKNYMNTGRDLPIWVASYVLMDYGTGIVNCSAHDERDFAFAKKYDIPLRAVLLPKDKEQAEKVKKLEIFYREPDGIIQEPAEFKGQTWQEARKPIIEYIVKNKFGSKAVNYKLRDWVFSRQRYWGEPIPIIHCEKCGIVPVPEKDLPVTLPKVKFYAPTGTGESPLADIAKWVNVKCPVCGGKAKRETNTMPQWAGSSWYYLRFIDPKNTKVLVDKKKEAYWSPVDMYVGGTEHTTRHLIYARFWHKFLQDIGVVNYAEPFTQLKNQGMILGADNRKMSKRWGNVINPDDVIKSHGADTLRIYEMFMGPFNAGASWNTDNLMGARRFVEKIWRLAEKGSKKPATKQSNSELEILFNKTIKKVGEDIENFSFNTAISALMILANMMEKEETISAKNWDDFLLVFAPFAPHLAEELWQKAGHKKTTVLEKWPSFNPNKLVSEKIKIIVQVNGKVRGELEVSGELGEVEIIKLAKQNETIKKWLNNEKVKKTIYINGKLLNLVI